MYKPTAKSYFSGSGLMDYGMALAGVNIVQSLEIDKQSVKTLRANFGHDIIEKDITVQTVLDQPKTDVILLTFPCTKYSNAADINGTRTGDDLFLHAFRHIALEEPEAFVVENVPGMRAFPVTMEAFEKIPDYYVQVFCPVDAMDWLPQKRKRLIMIGTKQRFPIAPPQNSKRVPLKDLIDPVPNMEIPEYIKARITGNYRDKPIITDPNNKNAVAPTCVAHYAKDRGTRMVKDPSHPLGIRPYTPREYARLQGVPDSFKFPVSNAQTYKQVGNGVAVPVATWVGKELLKYFN